MELLAWEAWKSWWKSWMLNPTSMKAGHIPACSSKSAAHTGHIQDLPSIHTSETSWAPCQRWSVSIPQRGRQGCAGVSTEGTKKQRAEAGDIHTGGDWRGSFGQPGVEGVEGWPNVFLWLTTVFCREDKGQLFLALQRKKIMNQQVYAAPREIIPGWRWEIPHEIRLVPGQGPRETVGYLSLLVFKAWRAVIRTRGWISFTLWY